MNLFVASFWEEHCVECAMPLCYRSCRMFERGGHGRCVRVEGLRESVEGTGTVRFRRWGKLEQVYHGTVIGAGGAARLSGWNRRLGGLWRLLGKYHRAVRWRVASFCGRRGVPNVWRLRLKSERDELLCAAVASGDGREIVREPLRLEAGKETSVEVRLPANDIAPGALFRLSAQDGEATGRIAILENSVGRREAEEAVLKCVAWDLDGTLWEGTLSEGDAVRLRPEAVALVRHLDSAGIVNSICSKNDQSVALAKLKEFGLEELFVFPQINWGPKSASIRRLAVEMNIGQDAIAFVDDRVENRNEVATECPGVRVLDVSQLEQLEEVLKRQPSALGSRRREMYREEMVRREEAKDYGTDVAAFLAQSGIEVELVALDEECAARCYELVNRTNQLTITAHRYSREAFDRLVSGCSSRAVRVRDKYGDYGIVGFVAWTTERVMELVFSCRVAMKGVERQVLDALPKGLKIDVVATARNEPIRQIVAQWLEERKC